MNAVNQYTTINSEPLTYSSRGDLSARGDWEYTYDAWGNLIQAHDTSSNALVQYWRDAFGHRAVKDVDGIKTVYFNLGTNQLEAYDISDDTASSTIYEPGIDCPLAEVSDSGVVTFYHQDWLGNVVLLTDAAGARVQSYTYDAWGKVNGFDGNGMPISESVIQSRFLYTAREFDKETGLHHYRARTYSGELGRFIQFDPIDFAAEDGNLLRYVANNPVNYYDPYGESAFVAALRWAGVAAVADGPIPVGDVIAGGILAGAALWDLYNWMNQSSSEKCHDIEGPKSPFEGEPGSTSRGNKQTRRYGEDQGIPKPMLTLDNFFY